MAFKNIIENIINEKKANTSLKEKRSMDIVNKSEPYLVGQMDNGENAYASDITLDWVDDGKKAPENKYRVTSNDQIGKVGEKKLTIVNDDNTLIGYADTEFNAYDFNNNPIGKVDIDNNVIDQSKNLIGSIDQFETLVRDFNNNVIGIVSTNNNVVDFNNNVIGHIGKDNIVYKTYPEVSLSMGYDYLKGNSDLEPYFKSEYMDNLLKDLPDELKGLNLKLKLPSKNSLGFGGYYDKYDNPISDDEFIQSEVLNPQAEEEPYFAQIEDPDNTMSTLYQTLDSDLPVAEKLTAILNQTKDGEKLINDNNPETQKASLTNIIDDILEINEISESLRKKLQYLENQDSFSYKDIRKILSTEYDHDIEINLDDLINDPKIIGKNFKEELKNFEKENGNIVSGKAFDKAFKNSQDYQNNLYRIVYHFKVKMSDKNNSNIEDEKLSSINTEKDNINQNTNEENKNES